MRVSAATRKYQGQDGQEKSVWVECGTLWLKSGHPVAIDLDVVPAPSESKDGRLQYRFRVFERDQQAGARPAARQAAVDEDVPF
jgi:hypothetical protein